MPNTLLLHFQNRSCNYGATKVNTTKYSVEKSESVLQVHGTVWDLSKNENGKEGLDGSTCRGRKGERMTGNEKGRV